MNCAVTCNCNGNRSVHVHAYVSTLHPFNDPHQISYPRFVLHLLSITSEHHEIEDDDVWYVVEEIRLINTLRAAWSWQENPLGSREWLRIRLLERA